MKKIQFTVEKNNDGYWAHRTEVGVTIGGYGETVADLRKDAAAGYNLFCEEVKKAKITEDQISFVYDLGAFFELHKEISPSGLASRLKMNKGQLSEYINGKRTLTEKQRTRIFTAVKELGKELSELELA